MTDPSATLQANDARPGAVRPRRMAVDVGGTFTDVAFMTDEGAVARHKLPSTSDNYAAAAVAGIANLCAELHLDPTSLDAVLHGCTVATNAILERKGARTALLTTRGFRDVLELRRIRVPRLYEPLWQKPEPLVPRHLRFEITERVGPDGHIVVPLALDEIDQVIGVLRSLEIEAVAVCFLHAHANPNHEQEVGRRLRATMPECFVTRSSEILPEIREYERTSTTVINAYVGPPVHRYVGDFVARLGEQRMRKPLMMMQSSGGMLDAATTMTQPVRIIECGPAAGVIGALHLSRMIGLGDVITLDMGGTTAKASAIENGRLFTTDEYEVGGGISLSSHRAHPREMKRTRDIVPKNALANHQAFRYLSLGFPLYRTYAEARWLARTTRESAGRGCQSSPNNRRMYAIVPRSEDQGPSQAKGDDVGTARRKKRVQ